MPTPTADPALHLSVRRVERESANFHGSGQFAHQIRRGDLQQMRGQHGQYPEASRWLIRSRRGAKTSAASIEPAP